MTIQRLAVALLTVNCLLLVSALAVTGRADAPDIAPVLRGRALELLDEHGQVRAQLNVEPDGQVVFRLRDRTGTIRVKLGADETGSGLVLLDETAALGVHIIASRAGTAEQPATTGIAMSAADGRHRLLRP